MADDLPGVPIAERAHVTPEQWQQLAKEIAAMCGQQIDLAELDDVIRLRQSYLETMHQCYLSWLEQIRTVIDARRALREGGANKNEGDAHE